MTQYTKILLTIICLTFTVQTKADSWIDPTWKRMLDSSDVIALIQYSSNGDFRASAKILKIYKGQLKSGDEIYISGFSNRYGPIDKMKKGNKYLVFLSFNEPTAERLEYWNEELGKKPKLKDFVEAYKNNRAYYVWSPTSGDLKIKGKTVQYDLIQTSFYSKQNFYSLTEFEAFLRAYQDKETAFDFSKTILEKIKPVSEDDLVSQYLMELYFLGYNKYDDIFESYVKVNNPSSKYALAQLMGNIKSVESRNILIALLDDKHSIVQGEVVRQLKNEPAEIVAPILLKHLKTSSSANFGPSNIMDPVMNRIDGGKVEIIKTLGELKYKPAIPDLLLLLDTDNDDLFELVIEALKNMGSKDYIPYINKHLDNKTHDLIFEISMMIAKDSLVECLPSFKNFISTCNRNSHPNYDYTISTCCGIGHFKDSATVAFLLSDYKHFFTYQDTLKSSEQKDWTKEYIETFTDLKIKEARPLIYKSIYDWFGLNEDFGINPKLFAAKKQLEDSIKTVFANSLEKKGYKLNYCIAFIENTVNIEKGDEPIAKYLLEVTIPSTEKGNEHQEIISKELKLNKESIFLRYENGWYHIEKQDRFDKSISSTPIYNFLSYAKAIPNPADLAFLQGLLDNDFVTDAYYRKKVSVAIDEIKTSLNK
jgi:hypothetical protein